MFSHEYHVRYGDYLDMERVKPSSLLDMVQDISTLHSDSCGYDMHTLYAQNLCWILQGLKLRLEQPVSNQKPVTIFTAVKNMKENSIPGRIVNISSVHGMITWVKRKMLPYCAAKAGLDMFTKSLGVEVARYGIRVNGIAPGLIMTKLADRYPPEQREAFQSKIPVEFLGQTEHIVPAIMFLSDIKSTEYIVGQILTVDGGQSVSGTIPAMKESFER